jgi:hypothetical protein
LREGERGRGREREREREGEGEREGVSFGQEFFFLDTFNPA